MTSSLRLRPHHPILRRSPDSVQFGAGPGGPVELRGGTPGLRRLLLGWRADQPAEVLLRRAADAGVPESDVRAVLAELHRAGALVDGSDVDRARAARAGAAVSIAGDGPLRPGLAEALEASGVTLTVSGADLVLLTARPSTPPTGPHLLVRLLDGVGLVGPLVLPRRSACLRCVDLHLTARDPCWPTIAADLAGRIGSAGPATVAATAALAAEQALAALDALAGTGPPPPTLDAVLELDPRRGVLRRRHRPPHPDCACGARHTGPGARGAEAVCSPRADGRESEL
jgi:bacteriocin biosynthesis cyclodehydratase domain-containing protein